MNLGQLTLEIINKELELKALRRERMKRVPHPSFDLQEQLYNIEHNIEYYMELDQFTIDKQVKFIDELVYLFQTEGYK